MAASDYLEQHIIDFVLNSNAEFTFTSPANVYIALFTAAPSDSGGGTECTGTNYARVDSGSFSTMTGITTGLTSNLAEIAFAQAGAGGWGTVTHIGLFDALTVGNLLYHGILTASKVVDENDTFKIAIGDLDITLS